MAGLRNRNGGPAGLAWDQGPRTDEDRGIGSGKKVATMEENQQGSFDIANPPEGFRLPGSELESSLSLDDSVPSSRHPDPELSLELPVTHLSDISSNDNFGGLSRTLSSSTTAYPDDRLQWEVGGENEECPIVRSSSPALGPDPNLSTPKRTSSKIPGLDVRVPPELKEWQNGYFLRDRAAVFPNPFASGLVAVVEPEGRLKIRSGAAAFVADREDGKVAGSSGWKICIYQLNRLSNVPDGPETCDDEKFTLLHQVQLQGFASSLEWLGPDQFVVGGDNGVFLFDKREKKARAKEKFGSTLEDDCQSCPDNTHNHFNGRCPDWSDHHEESDLSTSFLSGCSGLDLADSNSCTSEANSPVRSEIRCPPGEARDISDTTSSTGSAGSTSADRHSTLPPVLESSQTWPSHLLSSRPSLHVHSLGLPNGALVAVVFALQDESSKPDTNGAAPSTILPPSSGGPLNKDFGLVVYYVSHSKFLPVEEDESEDVSKKASIFDVAVVYQAHGGDHVLGSVFLSDSGQNQHHFLPGSGDKGRAVSMAASHRTVFLVTMLQNTNLIIHRISLPDNSLLGSGPTTASAADASAASSSHSLARFTISPFPRLLDLKEAAHLRTSEEADQPTLRIRGGRDGMLVLWSPSCVLVGQIRLDHLRSQLKLTGNFSGNGEASSSAPASGTLCFLNVDVSHVGNIFDIAVPLPDPGDSSLRLRSPVFSVLAQSGLEFFELDRTGHSSSKTGDSHAKNLLHFSSGELSSLKPEDRNGCNKNFIDHPSTSQPPGFADSGYMSFGSNSNSKSERTFGDNYSPKKTPELDRQENQVFVLPPFSVRRSYFRVQHPLSVSFVPDVSPYPPLIALGQGQGLSLTPFPRPPVASLNRLGDVAIADPSVGPIDDHGFTIRAAFLIGNSRSRTWKSQSVGCKRNPARSTYRNFPDMNADEPPIPASPFTLITASPLAQRLISSLHAPSTFRHFLSSGYSLDPRLNAEIIAREIINVDLMGNDSDAPPSVDRIESLHDLLSAWTAVSRLETTFLSRPPLLTSSRLRFNPGRGAVPPKLDPVSPKTSSRGPSRQASFPSPESPLQLPSSPRVNTTGERLKVDGLDLAYLGILPLWKKSFGCTWTGRVILSVVESARNETQAGQHGRTFERLPSETSGVDKNKSEARVSSKLFIRQVKRLVRQGGYPMDGIGWSKLKGWTSSKKEQPKVSTGSSVSMSTVMSNRLVPGDFPEARVLGLALLGWLGPVKAGNRLRQPSEEKHASNPSGQTRKPGAAKGDGQSPNNGKSNDETQLQNFHASVIRRCASAFRKGSPGTALSMAFFLAGPKVAGEVVRQAVSGENEDGGLAQAKKFTFELDDGHAFDWIRLGHIFARLAAYDQYNKEDQRPYPSGRTSAISKGQPDQTTSSSILLSSQEWEWCQTNLKHIHSYLESCADRDGGGKGHVVQIASAGMILDVLLGKSPEVFLSDYLSSFTGTKFVLRPGNSRDQKQIPSFLLAALPLPSILPLALLFLPPSELSKFLITTESWCVSSGHLPGLYLTGLTDRGAHLIAEYVRLTGDVLSAILLLERVRDRYVPLGPDSNHALSKCSVLAPGLYSGWTATLDDWIQAWKLWIPRAIISRFCTQLRFCPSPSPPSSSSSSNAPQFRRSHSYTTGPKGPPAYTKHPGTYLHRPPHSQHHPYSSTSYPDGSTSASAAPGVHGQPSSSCPVRVQSSAIVLRCTQCLRPLAAPPGQLTPAQAQSAMKSKSGSGSRLSQYAYSSLSTSAASSTSTVNNTSGVNSGGAAGRIDRYNAAVCSHCGTGVVKCSVCLGPLGADVDDEDEDDGDESHRDDPGLSGPESGSTISLLHRSYSGRARPGGGGGHSGGATISGAAARSHLYSGRGPASASSAPGPWRSGSRNWDRYRTHTGVGDVTGSANSGSAGAGGNGGLVNWARSKLVRFCVKCHHGMHERHARQWFSGQVLCPVPDCDCACGVV